MIWDTVVAVLLLASGVLALGAAFGLDRLPDFFDRMHAPSLAATLGTWSVSLASVIHFSGDGKLTLHAWLIAILLSITAPVTTVLLARVGLFRGRRAGDAVPPSLHAGHAGHAPADEPHAAARSESNAPSNPGSARSG